MNILLQKITRPEKATRSHLIGGSAGGPILKGDADCPSYCCGGCGLPLIVGITAKRFIDTSRRLDSAGAAIKPLGFPTGDYLLGRTVSMPDEQVTILSFNGPLVLTCFDCQTSSEMVSPNMIFDEPQ